MTFSYVKISFLIFVPLTMLKFVGVQSSVILYNFGKMWIFDTINRKLHGHLEIQNVSSHIEKYATCSLSSLVKYFSILRDKSCIFPQPCNNIFYEVNKIYLSVTKGQTIISGERREELENFQKHSSTSKAAE